MPEIGAWESVLRAPSQLGVEIGGVGMVGGIKASLKIRYLPEDLLVTLILVPLVQNVIPG